MVENYTRKPQFPDSRRIAPKWFDAVDSFAAHSCAYSRRHAEARAVSLGRRFVIRAVSLHRKTATVGLSRSDRCGNRLAGDVVCAFGAWASPMLNDPYF